MSARSAALGFLFAFPACLMPQDAGISQPEDVALAGGYPAEDTAG
jgi:hypothetical protein